MKNKKESGVVVVEATIVVTLVMIIITIMLYVGMTLYQQTLGSVMANQTASNIAQVYSNTLKDPFTGYIEPDKVYQSITYSNMKDDAYIEVIEKKANVFAQYRLKSSRILAESNATIEVELVKKPNELLKSQVVVTVHDKFDVPLVGMFGTNGFVEFESIGRADCVDILEYINGSEAVGNPEESNIGSLPDVSTCIITFVPDRDSPSKTIVVPVMKGKSVISSNKYTHSVMPKTPVKGTLDFDGWVTQENRPFTATTQVENNMIVYGSWKCDVVLNAEGGKVNSKDQHSFKAKVGWRTNIPSPTRYGYNFGGWFTDKNGRGTRYVSNDTVMTDDITLYAYWTCAHPSRYESSRSGTACEGGYIYYKCRQCNCDMGSVWYGGIGHNFTMRCNVKHAWSTPFNGAVSGGCGGYHVPNADCSTCGVRHGNRVYAYHIVCSRCHQTKNNFWCGNNHCAGNSRLPAWRLH